MDMVVKQDHISRRHQGWQRGLVPQRGGGCRHNVRTENPAQCVFQVVIQGHTAEGAG